MEMLFKFAHRNVFRNKRRSFLTGLSIFIAAVIVALSEGWTRGIMDNFWNGFVMYQTGNVRIVTEEFYSRERFLPVDELVLSPGPLISKIKDLPEVKSVEERVRFGILLSKGDQTVTAVGEGIDLLTNQMNLKQYVTNGTMKESGIYIGSLLAEKLGVHAGEELLLATKTSEGGLNGIKLPIAGIFRFGVTLMDREFFFIGLNDAKKLLKIQEGTTEIYVFTKQNSQSEQAAAEIGKFLSPGEIAMSYGKQLGSLYDLMKATENIMVFIEALIIFLASFVIINTMMMAVFERMPEIGTLKSIGMTDRELFINFVMEGGIIGAYGGIAGALTGYLLVILFSYTGVNMGALMDNVDVPMNNIIYPSANITVLWITIILSVVVSSLSAMVPALRAGKLTPVEALKSL